MAGVPRLLASLMAGLPERLPLAAVDAESTFAPSGASWWQTLGALVAVFGLLMLCLKLLGRLDRRRAGTEAQVLAVWSLGPKREIQVLRLGDEVHYIYRHDNAMVRLKEEDLSAWQAGHGQAPAPSGAAGWQRFLPGGWILPRRADPPRDLTSF